jgi:hypothetical protein
MCNHGCESDLVLNLFRNDPMIVDSIFRNLEYTLRKLRDLSKN